MKRRSVCEGERGRGGGEGRRVRWKVFTPVNGARAAAKKVDVARSLEAPYARSLA